jgi:deoxyribonuclease-1-like protein
MRRISISLIVLLALILVPLYGPCADQSSPTIKIATWNIENLGVSKCKDPVRIRKIASLLKEYDLIAVQEISNVKEQNDPDCPRNDTACPGDKNCGIVRKALEKYLNDENGLHYQFVFSPQVKDERYLLIYNPDKVTLESAELVNDPDDSKPICDSSPVSNGKMVRQPFKGRFKAGNFDFILLTAHTSPEINIQELDGLDYFYRQCELEGEPDIIILGDLNADCKYLKETDSIGLKGPDYVWVVSDDVDTTVAATGGCQDSCRIGCHFL